VFTLVLIHSIFFIYGVVCDGDGSDFWRIVGSLSMLLHIPHLCFLPFKRFNDFLGKYEVFEFFRHPVSRHFLFFFMFFLFHIAAASCRRRRRRRRRRRDDKL